MSLRHIPFYFLRPIRILQKYDRRNLRPDLVSGLTVGMIALPQSIAFALIADLPPQMGLYATIVATIVGALWGSSNQLSTGPANAISLLVLSTLLTVARPETSDFIVAAALLTVMAGVFQLVVGLARMGMLVNFVSHSVIVGFSSAAGLLIGLNQLLPLLGLRFQSNNLLQTLAGVVLHLPATHWPTAAIGIGAIIALMVLRKVKRNIPGPLLVLLAASGLVALLRLDQEGVAVIGALPRSLPPLTIPPLFDLGLIARLSTGALAVGAIGLVQTTAIAQSIANQTGQRLDSNQEFVGQGLANIAAGIFSGYAGAGSFARSAVSLKTGARTAVSGVFSAFLVLLSMFVLGPLLAYMPRAALAAVLIVIAYGLIDRVEIARIWRGLRGDAAIMLVTFLGTLFLEMQFAVLTGILFSFAFYLLRTSLPRVYSVLPDETFRHFIEQQPHQLPCPQLGILKISGDLYFGAVTHVQEAIQKHLNEHPDQRFLLLRMQGVNQCDFSGIQMLETILHLCRIRRGDLFLMKVQDPVLTSMKSTGFFDELGSDHFLPGDEAVAYLFYRILDPAICIYECEVRAFKECQNLPKFSWPQKILAHPVGLSETDVAGISPQTLWQQLSNGQRLPLVIDVREPREFKRGHIPGALLIPLSTLFSEEPTLPQDRDIVLVCRSGRRSRQAASLLQNEGYENLLILRGGMLAWEAGKLLEAVEYESTQL
jgi:SulP family sulfate permease